MNREGIAEVDHLVFGAATLEEGVAWCERTLGLTPDPGGKHALMGTHNRLLNISSPEHPRCYLEIIAIDPEAQTPPADGRARWFDLDHPALQQALRERGPGLIHWVARVPNLDAALAQRPEAGSAVAASRGALNWRIALRDDGRRLPPTLIEWGDAHPTDGLPDRGLRLLSLDTSNGLSARLLTPGGELLTLELIG